MTELPFFWVGAKEKAALALHRLLARNRRRFIHHDLTTWRGAKAALSAVEGFEGGAKVLAREVRPGGGCEVEFGVGALPKQEVAQALFAAGANEKVDIRAEVRGCAAAGQQLENLRAGRIVDRDAEFEATEMRRTALGRRHLREQISGQAVPAPDEEQADFIADALVDFAVEEVAKEPHQAADLFA